MVTATAASAHAFGARYDLPLPLDIYLAGAGLAILLTFVVSAVLLNPGRRLFYSAEIDIAATAPVTALGAKCLRRLAATLSLAIFILILATAFFGTASPTGNFAPTFVWVIWWVGFVYLSALLTNLWPWLSPWRPIALAAERLTGGHRSRLRYPDCVGYWPAVVLFFVFAWLLNREYWKDVH